MTWPVEQALQLWGMPGAGCQLAATRENRVYRVTSGERTFALRLHRKGLRSDSELRSELQWMAALNAGGLHVPAPVPSSNGILMHVVGGIQVDVLTWLPGAPIGSTAGGLAVNDRTGLYRNIGREMARLHSISDYWAPPEDFERLSWDWDGLVSDAPVWDRFWDNPSLKEAEHALMLELRDAARDMLKHETELDYGLIHADLVRENVMLNGDAVQFIDFDDSGFGYRLFDIATALLKNLKEPDYDALRSALIEGYLSVRQIDLGALDLFLALRAASYVGWIITRMDEDGAEARNRRFIDTAIPLAQSFLNAAADPQPKKPADTTELKQ